MSEDVRELIDRCLAGDTVAMAELVELYRGHVFGLCYRMLGHRQDAEDATQETFLRVFRALRTYDRDRDFRPWLLAIAGNRCRSHISSRYRRPRPRRLTGDGDEMVDGSPHPAGERELVEEVELALDQLREEYRQAFLLFHEQQLSYAEIGEALGCPVGTVKTWVHRARREMAEWIRRRGVVEEVER